MCERPVRIAILDDGVYPAACPVAGSFLIDDDLSVVLNRDAVSPYSHGSMCAHIMGCYTELEKMEVYSIQILKGDTLRGNIGRLLKAFQLCVFMDIRLIHLSVGTYAFEDFNRLEEAVRRLLDSERLLVAATGNRGTVTYPAYLPEVIGVCHHPQLTEDEYIYCSDPFTRIHFQASARHKLMIEGQEIETPVSNSYAAPLITAKILSYLKENTDLGRDEILRLLMKDARHYSFLQNNRQCSYPLVEIPVVMLSGFSTERLAHLMKVLVDGLHRDDYHVRSATDLSGIRPWDEMFLPETANLDLFIARMAWYFSCEIILLGRTSYLPSDKCKNVSLWIYGEESSSVQTGNQAESQVLWVAELPDYEVYGLMTALLI